MPSKLFSPMAPGRAPAPFPSSQAQQRFRQAPLQPWYVGFVLLDLLMLGGAAILVYFGHLASSPGGLPSLLPALLAFFQDGYFGNTALFAAFLVAACKRNGLYVEFPPSSALDEALAVAKAVVFSCLALMAFLFLSRNVVMSRLILAGMGVGSFVGLVAIRNLRRATFRRQVEKRSRHVLIVGAGKVGQAVADYLTRNRNLGYVVKGFLDENHHDEPLMLGRIPDFEDVARAHFIDDVIVTIPSERALVKHLAFQAAAAKLNLKVVPELFDGLALHAPLEYIGDFPVMSVHRERSRKSELFFKRLMDVVVSSIALLALGPLMVLIALAIKLESRGPVLYKPSRVGRKGKVFRCFKFRTMVVDADKKLKELQHLNERTGILFKMANDPRITRVGRVLRKYSLDELPQLLNVLLGSMSLVGPRPPEVGEYAQYSLEHFKRLDVTPGVTGLWQVTSRRDPSFESYIGQDLEYIENWSLWMDAKILFRTIPVVLRGTGQ